MLGNGRNITLQVLLQSRAIETNRAEATGHDDPFLALTDDLDQLGEEVRALYKSDLPPAVIHQISRGAREQIAIGRLILDDCMLRAARDTLTPKHMANAEKWIAGVRNWIEKRKTAYAVNCRRKLCVVKSRR